MTDTLTVCHVKGSLGNGYMLHGIRARDEIIAEARKHAQYVKDQADILLNTPDDELECLIVRGSVVQRVIRELKP